MDAQTVVLSCHLLPQFKKQPFRVKGTNYEIYVFLGSLANILNRNRSILSQMMFGCYK